MTRLDIRFPAESLESLCQALAEGEHDLGIEHTLAGYAVIAWPDLAEMARERHEADECAAERRREDGR